MSEISEIEIKSMTKEQNYMRGYKDGKSDVLDKIRAEIVAKHCKNREYDDFTNGYSVGLEDALEIIDKYREGENEKNKKRFENELIMMQTNIFPYKGE